MRGIVESEEILPIPDEPIWIKKRAIEKCRDPSWSMIEKESVIRSFTLTAPYLPKYLWKFWERDLKKMGIRWPIFLRIISTQHRAVEKWVEGKLSWDELAGAIRGEVLDLNKGR